MWGIIPAAGKGSRIQPLAFSKELLPMRGDLQGDLRRPRAVSDYLMERFALAGANRICIVISSDKADILEYYGGAAWSASICYTVQPNPEGLCDAIFRALLVIDPDSPVVIGLPDTIWFPADALRQLPDDRFSFLLFPVANPQFFDSVEFTPEGRVTAIRVKQADALSPWIWGAFKMPGSTLRELFELWTRRGRRDEYIGTLVNAWIEEGREAWGVRAGVSYFDVGTMDGYLDAIRNLAERTPETSIGGQAA
jgi:glucose-1-phosphate thymidylyltransferase